jgi:hypothetical protein
VEKVLKLCFYTDLPIYIFLVHTRAMASTRILNIIGTLIAVEYGLQIKNEGTQRSKDQFVAKLKAELNTGGAVAYNETVSAFFKYRDQYAQLPEASNYEKVIRSLLTLIDEFVQQQQVPTSRMPIASAQPPPKSTTTAPPIASAQPPPKSTTTTAAPPIPPRPKTSNRVPSAPQPPPAAPQPGDDVSVSSRTTTVQQPTSEQLAKRFTTELMTTYKTPEERIYVAIHTDTRANDEIFKKSMNMFIYNQFLNTAIFTDIPDADGTQLAPVYYPILSMFTRYNSYAIANLVNLYIHKNQVTLPWQTLAGQWTDIPDPLARLNTAYDVINAGYYDKAGLTNNYIVVQYKSTIEWTHLRQQIDASDDPYGFALSELETYVYQTTDNMTRAKFDTIANYMETLPRRKATTAPDVVDLQSVPVDTGSVHESVSTSVPPESVYERLQKMRAEYNTFFITLWRLTVPDGESLLDEFDNPVQIFVDKYADNHHIFEVSQHTKDIFNEWQDPKHSSLWEADKPKAQRGISRIYGKEIDDDETLMRYWAMLGCAVSSDRRALGHSSPRGQETDDPFEIPRTPTSLSRTLSDQEQEEEEETTDGSIVAPPQVDPYGIPLTPSSSDSSNVPRSRPSSPPNTGNDVPLAPPPPTSDYLHKRSDIAIKKTITISMDPDAIIVKEKEPPLATVHDIVNQRGKLKTRPVAEDDKKPVASVPTPMVALRKTPSSVASVSSAHVLVSEPIKKPASVASSDINSLLGMVQENGKFASLRDQALALAAEEEDEDDKGEGGNDKEEWDTNDKDTTTKPEKTKSDIENGYLYYGKEAPKAIREVFKIFQKGGKKETKVDQHFELKEFNQLLLGPQKLGREFLEIAQGQYANTYKALGLKPTKATVENVMEPAFTQWVDWWVESGSEHLNMLAKDPKDPKGLKAMTWKHGDKQGTKWSPVILRNILLALGFYVTGDGDDRVLRDQKSNIDTPFSVNPNAKAKTKAKAKPEEKKQDVATKQSNDEIDIFSPFTAEMLIIASDEVKALLDARPTDATQMNQRIRVPIAKAVIKALGADMELLELGHDGHCGYYAMAHMIDLPHWQGMLKVRLELAKYINNTLTREQWEMFEMTDNLEQSLRLSSMQAVFGENDHKSMEVLFSSNSNRIPVVTDTNLVTDEQFKLLKSGYVRSVISLTQSELRRDKTLPVYKWASAAEFGICSCVSPNNLLDIMIIEIGDTRTDITIRTLENKNPLAPHITDKRWILINYTGKHWDIAVNSADLGRARAMRIKDAPGKYWIE